MYRSMQIRHQQILELQRQIDALSKKIDPVQIKQPNFLVEGYGYPKKWFNISKNRSHHKSKRSLQEGFTKFPTEVLSNGIAAGKIEFYSTNTRSRSKRFEDPKSSSRMLKTVWQKPIFVWWSASQKDLSTRDWFSIWFKKAISAWCVRWRNWVSAEVFNLCYLVD